MLRPLAQSSMARTNQRLIPPNLDLRFLPIHSESSLWATNTWLLAPMRANVQELSKFCQMRS